jgi:hypothetical protein
MIGYTALLERLTAIRDNLVQVSLQTATEW